MGDRLGTPGAVGIFIFFKTVTIILRRLKNCLQFLSLWLVHLIAVVHAIDSNIFLFQVHAFEWRQLGKRNERIVCALREETWRVFFEVVYVQKYPPIIKKKNSQALFLLQDANWVNKECFFLYIEIGNTLWKCVSLLEIEFWYKKIFFYWYLSVVRPTRACYMFFFFWS